MGLATEILTERKLEYLVKEFDLVPGEIKKLFAGVIQDYMVENNVILAE